MVDPDEGTELRFISATTINGIRCAILEKDDVVTEIQYWKQSVLCTMLGANPPFEVMQGFIKRIWSTLDIDKIVQVRKGVLLFVLVICRISKQWKEEGYFALTLNLSLSKDGTLIWTCK